VAYLAATWRRDEGDTDSPGPGRFMRGEYGRGYGHAPAIGQMPMKKLLQTTLGLLLTSTLSQAVAQTLLQPGVTPASQNSPAAGGTGPQLKQPQAAVQTSPPGAPGSTVIRAKGPANDTPAPAIRKAATAPASIGVLDAAGIPLQGYIQVAPNRVYDPARKRYYWTVPAGEQQQIVK